jgi:hypothetical protein
MASRFGNLSGTKKVILGAGVIALATGVAVTIYFSIKKTRTVTLVRTVRVLKPRAVCVSEGSVEATTENDFQVDFTWDPSEISVEERSNMSIVIDLEHTTEAERYMKVVLLTEEIPGRESYCYIEEDENTAENFTTGLPETTDPVSIRLVLTSTQAILSRKVTDGEWETLITKTIATHIDENFVPVPNTYRVGAISTNPTGLACICDLTTTDEEEVAESSEEVVEKYNVVGIAAGATVAAVGLGAIGYALLSKPNA